MVVKTAAIDAFNGRDIKMLRGLRVVTTALKDIVTPWLFRELGLWLSVSSLGRLQAVSDTPSL